MEFNRRFTNKMLEVFESNPLEGETSNLLGHLTLDHNNVFNINLVVNIDSDEIEIPVIAIRHYEFHIKNVISSPTLFNTKKVLLPLYNNSSDRVRSTFDSIIIEMFNVPYRSRLVKITTNKEDIYYGGRGIILDRDYTPLLLCTYSVKKVLDDNGYNMVYHRPICHISPKVFSESDRVVNKGIIKKVIPFFSNTEITSPRNTTFLTGDASKVKVVVDNFDDFFVRPNQPTPNACSNDILNECLIDNIEDIKTLI